MTSRRVLLVDDHGLVRAGLRCLLESMLDIEVVGEAGDGREALKLIEKLHPDVVLMDLSMPVLNGLEAIRRSAKLAPKPRVLVLSMHADKVYVRHALAAGAAGYVLKTADRGELAMAVATVARGESWLSPAIAKSVIEDLIAGTPDEDLTPRQREVLQLIAEGHSTKDIARRLHLSVKTIETHRAQIMQRLDIHDVAGLVRYAIRRLLVSGES
jgi:DNA-binding NarL/FixJ family response regulator